MRNFIEITVKNIDIHINTMSHESTVNLINNY